MSIGKSNLQFTGDAVSGQELSRPTGLHRTLKGLGKRLRERRRRQDRRSLLESLEHRHLMAGPNLVGIQPNENSLLFEGTQLNTAPRELVFKFDDATAINPATLDGIRITRAGDDAVFEAARATSDLGTGGAVLLEFRAVPTGTAGEGIVVQFTSSSRAGSGAPIITVANNVITLNLNSNPARPTQVRDLISAVAADPNASRLLQVFSVSGPTSFALGTSVPSGTQVTLRGANAADAVSDLGTNNALRVRFLSTTPGAEGRGTRIILQRADAGGPANPLVLVNGNQVTVRINSNAGNETTAAQLINAINTNPEASQIVTAILEAGPATTLLGNRPAFPRTLALTGATDILVEPGFVGIGRTPNEVVFRFAETLPDDKYQIDIFGSGSLALTNVDGEAFNNGRNLQRRFEINLPPEVLAVVPEPMRRNASGQLAPEVGVIEVHFSEALDPAAAINKAFYQLIFTGDTATTADDNRVVYPTSDGTLGGSTVVGGQPTIVYDQATNIVRLTFPNALSRLFPTAGQVISTTALRLRIGSALTSAPAPSTATISADPGDSINTSFNLGDFTATDTNGTRSVRLNSEIRNTVDYGLELPGPNVGGIRAIRPQDPSRTDRPVPLDFWRNGADSVNGISVIEYNFPSTFGGVDPATPGVGTGQTFFNLISDAQRQRVREVLSLFSEYLGVQFIERPAGPTSNAFFSIAVGDLRATGPAVSSAPGGLPANTADRNGDGIQDLVVLDFQDFDQSTDDQFGGEFFRGAMLAVGQLLGYGYADSLPQPVTQSSGFVFSPGTDNEPTYPSVADIVNGQYLYRPDSTDIDVYRFSLQTAAKVSIQTFAERLTNGSLLDTQLRLYRQDDATGAFVEIAQNDDYFSNDSLIELDLPRGDYFIGVSASGNSTYNPTIPGSGFGGKTEGAYELRLTTKVNTTVGIVDATNRLLDGNGDGESDGVFNFWFVPTDASNTLYVDKAASTAGNGSLTSPFRNISAAVAAATPGTTIRVVANGGADGRISTPADNLTYEIGVNNLGSALADGATLDLPRGVRLIIDAGTIFKMRSSRVGVGSTAPLLDRSDAAIQVLGTPVLVESNGLVARDAAGAVVPGSVYFTSYNDTSLGFRSPSITTPPAQAGDWGGIDIRSDIDVTDTSRRNRENEGVFLNHIQFADLRYGGGQVRIDGRPVVVSPIELALTRATVMNSRISLSADAAIAATPDTFAETRFDEPFFQQNGVFTPTTSRVGPAIFGNTVIDNSINGLFVRVSTRTGDVLQPLTAQARFDDTDIVHVLAENLVVAGTPGGPIAPSQSPSSLGMGLIGLAGGGNVAPGTYVYRVSYASPSSESAASVDTARVVLAATGQIQLSRIPTVPAGSGFTQRRIYRASVAADGTVGEFLRVAELNATDTTFVDRLAAGTTSLPSITDRLTSRLDASLKLDPGTILKVGGSRIDVTFGASFIAEGTLEDPIVMTSLRDKRYGTGGTFDTNSDSVETQITAGDWGGLYVGHTASGSLDRVVLAGAGGTTRIQGGFASFNPIEVHQGNLRVANSRFENNADGRGFVNTSNPTRVGRGDNGTGTIFVRGAQPIIVNNEMVDGSGPVISFDVNSLVFNEVVDPGRSTARLDRFESIGNSGPLVAGNRIDDNTLNGMEVRPGQVATEVVFDDTDMVHIVRGSIEVPNQHIFGGLRLESDSRGSLVVKFESTNNSTAGIVAGGSLASAANQFVDIRDRIGGSLQVVGHPDFPVILTTLSDDFSGAGFTPSGLPQRDTNNNGIIGGDLADQAGDGLVRLPVGPEVDNGTLIDNDVAQTTPGFFQAQIGNANDILQSGVTVTTDAGVLINQDFVFRYSTFIRVGNATISLAASVITQPATLIADDRVESRGTFAGPNGTVNWIATSFFIDGTTRLFSRLDLSSANFSPLGAIQVISYLDEDVLGLTDDILYTVGTPGEADFRLFTIDAALRIGFSHGGFYTNGENQANATYAGWAANSFPALQTAITASTQLFSLPGVVNVQNLPQGTDPEFGVTFGPADVTTAHAWNVTETATTATVTSFLELIASDPSTTSPFQQVQSGLWNGLVIREGASDRNVQGTKEIEPDKGVVTDSNAVPAQAQFLGELAPNIQSGDESRRLGFVVDGALTRTKQTVNGVTLAADMDVYSFIAEAGTQVWLDIDRTDLSLDTVIELVDANGRTLALSDDSLAESRGDFAIQVGQGFQSTSARPLNTVPVAAGLATAAYQDAYSTNPRDAGLRVVLPGSPGNRNLYHVRVRSSSLRPGDARSTLLTNFDGLTTGSYRLQVRLQEADEFPGTQVRFADVRYATKGIQVIGQPLRNPITGDEYETSSPNETFASAQPLGLFDVGIDATATSLTGPLASDRLAKSVSGVLSSATDVDWYRFDINYQNLTRDDSSLFMSTIFDIDYADGFARSDIAIYVFNAAGQLVLTGADSNIADDLPTGQDGTSSSDLSRGSAGNLDPFIGVAELAEGTYFVAVANQSQIPSVLDQFRVATTTNPLVRLEPIDSITRIAEDRIDSVGGGTASQPVVPLLFDGNNSTIPYTFNDMIMYRLSGPSFGLTNPFTGQNYGVIGATGTGFADMAFRANGELFGYSLPNTLVAGDLDNAYSYFRINSETGALTNVGLTGIQTYHAVIDANGARAVVDSNDGLSVQGMAFRDNQLGFFVGNRPFNRNIPNPPGFPPSQQNAYFQNIIYAFNPATGEASGLGSPNREVVTIGGVQFDQRANGAGTQIRERGYIETGTGPGGQAIGSQLVVPRATVVNPDGSTVAQLNDGATFAIQTGLNAPPFLIELDSGPVLNFTTNPTAGNFPIDGLTFSLTTPTGTQVYELNSGPVIVLDATQVIDGASVTVQDAAGLTRVFEFNSNATLINPNATSVPFTIGATSAQLASALAAAISASDFGATAFATPGQGRVDLVGESTTVAPTVSGAGLSVSGTAGSTDPNIPAANIIQIRENFTGAELAQAVAAATGGAVAGDRVNFRNVTATNILNLTVRNLVTQTGTSGVALGSTGVRFFVTDTAEAIAIRIAQAVNNTASIQAAGISATTNQNLVIFQNAVLNGGNNSVDPAFSVGGVPPGGIVRGIAMIGTSLYAVSDAGGLYVVTNPTATVQGPIGSYVTTSTDLIGLNFTGLSTGPQNLEGGRFANLLFGVTAGGDLYAFDTAGRLQPVFAGGATSINIGAGVRGIDFSTLDANLWHTSERRGTDPGHGINANDNGTRAATPGGTSFYFGAEATDQEILANALTSPFAIPRQDGQAVRNTYNFPGGAKGAIESNPFSLSGYSAADLPTLYFNYFLATDGVSSITPGISDQDAFRVYAITEDGVEHLLTTNNLAGGVGVGGEFADPTGSTDPTLAAIYDDDITVEVQPTFDNTASWRQARVSLSEFAGQSSIRLRVEFSTGASFGDGTLGIRTVAGNMLQDGQTIEVGGRTFELDLGTTLAIPSGLEISTLYSLPTSTPTTRVVAVVGGVTYVLNDGQRTVDVAAGEVSVGLQLLGDGPLSTITASTVATRLAAAITANGLPTTQVPFSFLTEPNDELMQATTIPAVSGSAVISGAGELGTPSDVDLFRFAVPAGATVRVDMTSVVPNAFIGNVRLFNSQGNQIAIGTTGTPAEYTATSSETIFIGFSSNANINYNPIVSGSGDAGVAGAYTATIEIDPDFRVVQTGSRLQITGGIAATGGADGLVVATGASGTSDIPVIVDRGMSANEVALALQEAIARQFSGGVLAAYPVAAGTITLAGLTVGDTGPFGLSGIRSGDAFGSTGVARAQANNFEGVFVDDFVIGFAERGELVTESATTPAFIADPLRPLRGPAQGSYQLEIRDGSEYVNSFENATFRTFDTNDRLATGLTAVVNPIAQIIDGASFELSDGTNSVVFELDIETAPGVSNGSTSGRVPVRIPASVAADSSNDGSAAVAAAIIEAFNDPGVRLLINAAAVDAGGFDSLGGNRINLFGSVSIQNDTGVFAALTQGALRGDSNRDRTAQGTVVIENSRFMFNSDVGVELSHGETAQVAGQTTNTVLAYPRNLIELNTERFVPGVVVQSNILAFNDTAGLRINGVSSGGSGADPVPFDRIVNNTIVGGSVAPAAPTVPANFQGVFFPGGAISFADVVTSFTQGTGVGTTFANPVRAIGAPDHMGRGEEPVDGQLTTSLGSGGVLTVQFTDNFLTGSGDSRPDLIIFETGEIESVRVAVSRDGVSFFDVGVIGGVDTTINLDAFGFGREDRFSFVRLTDLRQGTLTSGPVGADIDAIGALSTVPVTRFTPGGQGIVVSNSAAPTLLNNIISNTTTGLNIDGSSNLSVVGATAYYRNGANSSGTPAISLGQFPDVIPATIELFVDPVNLVFAPRAGVSIIDSSIDSLEDRASLFVVRNAVGLPASPILAPRFDVSGQLRVDDPTVSSPPGVGERVFKDRGASDRADQSGPRAVLISPRAEDLSTASGQVAVARGSVFSSFDIQLVDGIAPADATPGVGVDDETVTANSVLVSKDGVPLVEGVDYRFGYESSSNIIRITPIAGIWEDDATYVVRLLDATDSVLRFSTGAEIADGAITSLLTTAGRFVDLEAEKGISINVSNAIVGNNIDGQIITVFDGALGLSFEINTNLLTTPGNIAVTVPATASTTEIAVALAAAIEASALNLTATSIGSVVQLLGPSSLATATPLTPVSSLFSVSGAIGTRVGFGIGIPADGAALDDTVLDGQTFTIRRGGNLVRTFEIDFGGGIQTPGAIAVTTIGTPTIDQLAIAMVNAIGGAGLGLAPVYAGQGRIVLGGDANYSLDLTDSGFVQLGAAGQVASVPVVIPIDATTDEVVAAYAAAIAGASLPGVSSAIVGDRLILDGVAAASGANSVPLPIIRDEVGNQLQSNRPDGRTELTIFVGGGFDYGDAPAPYRASLADGGPRARVAAGFSIGATNTPDNDAAFNDGDLGDDGVQLVGVAASGFTAEFTVDVRSDREIFYVDAWIDWNRNGLFESNEVTRYRSPAAPGTGLPIVGVGVNSIGINVPAGVTSGQTFARFRLSTVPGLGANETAVDTLGEILPGEIEDHSIIVQSNIYQNPLNNTDVNRSGTITPLDALNIINLLAIYNRSPERTLPAGAIVLTQPDSFAFMTDIVNGRFLPDVDGNGLVTANDALRVINELSRIRRGSSSASGEGEGFVPVGNGLLASPLTFATEQVATTSVETTQPTVSMKSSVSAPAITTSVFDSAQVMALDDILDSLASDDRTGSSSDESAVDHVFSGLGSGL